MGTYTCTITIDKDAGIKLVVDDADNSRTQTITMTGDSIITTVKGEKTSTITQTHDSITIDVEKFTLNAQEVAVVAQKTVSIKTDSGNITIESGKDMTLKVDAKATISCTDAACSASSTWEQKAPTHKLSADTSLSIKSGATAALEGAQLSVKGSATVALESSGSMDIKGSMVQVGAPMIKLG